MVGRNLRVAGVSQLLQNHDAPTEILRNSAFRTDYRLTGSYSEMSDCQPSVQNTEKLPTTRKEPMEEALRASKMRGKAWRIYGFLFGVLKGRAREWGESQSLACHLRFDLSDLGKNPVPKNVRSLSIPARVGPLLHHFKRKPEILNDFMWRPVTNHQYQFWMTRRHVHHTVGGIALPSNRNFRSVTFIESRRRK